MEEANEVQFTGSTWIDLFYPPLSPLAMEDLQYVSHGEGASSVGYNRNQQQDIIVAGEALKHHTNTPQPLSQTNIPIACTLIHLLLDAMVGRWDLWEPSSELC